MEEKKAHEQQEKRVKVEDLPEPEQELSAGEAKEVKGGSRYAFASINKTQPSNDLNSDFPGTGAND